LYNSSILLIWEKQQRKDKKSYKTKKATAVAMESTNKQKAHSSAIVSPIKTVVDCKNTKKYQILDVIFFAFF